MAIKNIIPHIRGEVAKDNKYYFAKGTFVTLGETVIFGNQQYEVIRNSFTGQFALDNQFGQVFLDDLSDKDLLKLKRSTYVAE